MKILQLIVFVSMVCMGRHAYAQIPGPVDLGIENITQETSYWCWAAVSQQVIYWLQGDSPEQCELVARAYDQSSDYCCDNASACNVAGNLQQIQFLIRTYGGRYSSLALPANPMILYNTLLSNRAVILFLQTTPFIGHFVVLRGMEFLPTPSGPVPVLYINDPMSYFTQPVPFVNLIPMWRAAIVVY